MLAGILWQFGVVQLDNFLALVSESLLLGHRHSFEFIASDGKKIFSVGFLDLMQFSTAVSAVVSKRID